MEPKGAGAKLTLTPHSSPTLSASPPSVCLSVNHIMHRKDPGATVFASGYKSDVLVLKFGFTVSKSSVCCSA